MKNILHRRFFIFLIPILLVIGHYVKLFIPIEDIFSRGTQPLESLVYRFSISFRRTFFSNTEVGGNLAKKNEKLEDEIQNLLIQIAHLQALLNDVELSKEQQQFLEEKKIRAIPARVTYREGELVFNQKLFVNKGSAAGIVKGAPAIIKDGIIIGILSEVQNYSSQITPLNNPEILINTWLDNEQHSSGLLHGDFNLTLKMDYLPQTDFIENGTLVTTSGRDKLIPEGLVVGLVREIENLPGAIFQSVIIDPASKIDNIGTVSIIIP